MLVQYTERLRKAEVNHRSATTIVLDPDLLQQSMQFFCSQAEWLYMQAMGLQGYARIHCTCIQVIYPIQCCVCGVFMILRHNFLCISRSSPIPPEEVRFQLAAVPEFFFESIAEFVLFCSRLVQYSHACTCNCTYMLL